MKTEGYLLSLQMLNKNNNENISAPKRVSNVGGSQDENNCRTKTSSLRLRFKNSCLRKKKRIYKLRNWFIDSILFKIASLFEAIVMVSTLAFFLFSYGFRIWFLFIYIFSVNQWFIIIGQKLISNGGVRFIWFINLVFFIDILMFIH